MNRVLVFLIVIFMPVFSLAETIELKNGKVVEGKIVEETADWIKVDTGIGVNITYYKDELKDYKKEITFTHREPSDYKTGDVNQKEVKLPVVFTMDELTPEQREYVDKNYITTGVAQLDLSSKDSGVKIRPPNPEELTIAANKLFQHRRFQEALVKIQEAIDQDQDYLEAYRVKADILQESGSADQSIPLYNKILEKSPADDMVYMNRGYAYGRLGQFNRAIEDYNKALELNPNNINAISARASAYMQTGEISLAKKDYETLISFDQEQAYFGLGNVAGYYRNWDEALSYYDKTIALSPDFAPAYLMKGQTLLQMDRKQEASEAIKKAKSLGIAISPELEKAIQ